MTDHLMQMTGHTADGLEHWRCPACGREFLLRWPPAYYKQLLNEGDPTYDRRGEIQAESTRLQAYEPDRLHDDPRLAVFDEWLKGRV